MKASLIYKNAMWIVICKIIQSLLQLLVGMLCARYLGPSNYGLINYAASIVAFVMPIMKLGLNATLVYELTESPEKEGEIMGTSLVMNIVSSLFCMAGVFGFVSVVDAGDTVTILVCVLYSLSVFFAALEIVQYWFQYKLQSKQSSLVMLVAYIVVSIYKIYLLITGKSVYWFAVVNAVDFGIIGISLIFIYLKTGAPLKFSFVRAKAMFMKSKFYIVSSLMVVVFQSTDHVMLTAMKGKEQNGYYTAAITCASVIQFVYVAIIDSFRPVILSSKKKEDHVGYKKLLSGLFSIIFYMALLQSLAFTVMAKPIVAILYGSEYASSVSVLRMLVWYLAFSYIGSVRNVWILAEQKQKHLLVINLFGALLNIVLNLFMIYFWSAFGAAVASLLTQIFTNFVLDLFISRYAKAIACY